MDSRMEEIIEANIMATHAHQITLARGAFPAYEAGKLPDADIKSLVSHQASLLKSDPVAVRAWARGEASVFNPKKDLEPILAVSLPLAESLPVNVITRYLAVQASRSRVEIRAVASLFQITLEEGRDGDIMQDLIDFYIALGLPVHRAQIGVADDESALLILGRELAPPTAPSPFGTDLKNWQVHGAALKSWAEKKLHIRDDAVLAGELREEPAVKALLPKLKALPEQKIAVIGHSYTMHLHWASPSAFVPIVISLMKTVNPDVQIRQWERGGLKAHQARDRFYPEVLTWKPDTVLMVVDYRKEADLDAFREMASGFKKSGIEPIYGRGLFAGTFAGKNPGQRQKRRGHGHSRQSGAAGVAGKEFVPQFRRHPYAGAVPPGDGGGVAEIYGEIKRWRS
jgi:hypothetical protein